MLQQYKQQHLVFFKLLGRNFAEAGRKPDTNLKKNPARAMEIGGEIGIAAVFKK